MLKLPTFVTTLGRIPYLQEDRESHGIYFQSPRYRQYLERKKIFITEFVSQICIMATKTSIRVLNSSLGLIKSAKITRVPL